MVIPTCAAPCPAAGVMPVIQGTSAAADQAHSAWVVTVMDAAPPAGEITPGDTASATAHFTGVGWTSVVDDLLQPAAPAAPSASTSESRRQNK
jgi:hypothetical protein